MENDPLKQSSNRLSQMEEGPPEASPLNQREVAYEIYYNPEEEMKELPPIDQNADLWNEPIEFHNNPTADVEIQMKRGDTLNEAEEGITKGEHHNMSLLDEDAGEDLTDKEDESEGKDYSGDSSPGGVPKLKDLRYGDKIVLYIDGECKYYLSSDGFATKRLYFRAGCSCRKRGETFIVVPEVSNHQTTNMKTMINMWKKRKRDNKSVDATASSTAARFQKFSSIYKEDIPKEINRIWGFHKNKCGEPVIYGDRIQLVHAKTQLFVKISKKVDLSGKRYVAEIREEPKSSQNKMLREKKDLLRVYSLKLVPLSSAGTHFIIHHLLNYQEKERVLQDDTFYLAFPDTSILEKMFFLYFKPPYMIDKTETKKELKNNSKNCMFNAYLYEEDSKTTLRFAPVKENFLKNHICKEISGKTLWITHIEEPYYLCLDTIEKRPEFEDSHLNDLISQTSGEAKSQRFGLGFVRFNPGESKPTNGLWLLFASKDETSKDKITLKNLYYDAWIKDLTIEQDDRSGEEIGIIKDKSTFRMRSSVDMNKGHIQMYRKVEHTVGKEKGSISKKDKEMEGAALLDNTRFRIVLASGHEHLLTTEVAEMASFIRRFDIQLVQKKFDFTESGVLWILSKLLHSLKLLCLNASPSAIIASEPYHVPYEYIQGLLRESHCIASMSLLLQKLYPGGSSIDLKALKYVKQKILKQLLGLLAVAVKNNKLNQIYAFTNCMKIVQKYIGLKLPDNAEKAALLAVVDNCEEIIIDFSLDNILSQFLHELSSASFHEKMKKYEILQILRKFCVFNGKGITATQNLLFETLFGSENGQKILLPFKFSGDKPDLRITLENGADVNFCQPLPEGYQGTKAKSILKYFKAQLYILIDICHDNKKCQVSLKEMFPIDKLMHNISSEYLGTEAKAGLIRIFLSLMSNSDTLAYMEKPQLQRSWNDDIIKIQKKPPDFISFKDLEQLKNNICEYVEKSTVCIEASLQKEYLRILTFLMNYDLILGEVKSQDDFITQLDQAYRLLGLMFNYCITTLNELSKSSGDNRMMEKKTSTMTAAKLDEIGEEAAQEIGGEKDEVKQVVEISKADYYLKYPMKFLYIFTSLANADKFQVTDSNQEAEDGVLLEEEIFAFLNQLILIVEDASITAFTHMFRRCYNQGLKNYCKTFILQLFNQGKIKHEKETVIPEVTDALLYRDIKALYKEWLGEYSDDKDDGLMSILMKMLVSSTNIQLETSLLNLIIGYKLPKACFFHNLESLYLNCQKKRSYNRSGSKNTEDKNQQKQEELSRLLPLMTACIGQANIWLNVTDIKNLQQSSGALENFRNLLAKFYSLFSLDDEDYSKSIFESGKTRFKKIVNPDPKFKILLIKRKASMGDAITTVIIEFLKVSAKAKKEAADNVLDGSENLGMHAVSFSREVLGLIDLCNDILITFCENMPKAKTRMLKHLAKIKLIAPRPDGDRKKWLLHSQLMETDIALLTEIVKDNKQMANLNNQQVRIFTELISMLNQSISEFNIDKIFFLFESILNQTTHEELYNLVLGYFWQNRTRIDFDNILKSVLPDPSEANIAKQLQLLKAVLLMGQSKYLKKAKNKLREMFPIPNLSLAFHKIKPLYYENEQASLLEFLKYLVEIYDVLYLKEKQRDEEILHGISIFFIDQQTGVENEAIKNPMHVYLLAEIYNLLKDYNMWVRKLPNPSSRIIENTFENKLVKKLSDFAPSETNKEIAKAIRIVTGKFEDIQNQVLKKEDPTGIKDENEKTLDEENKQAPSLERVRPQLMRGEEFIDEEDEHLDEKVNEKFDEIRTELQKDDEINEHLQDEAEFFYKEILSTIEDCDEFEDSSNFAKKAAKKDKARLHTKFVEKLIFYIGRAGKVNLKPRILKLFLRTFIKVIDNAGGEDDNTAKQNRTLLILDRLGMTKTLLNLLCSDESEILDSVFPYFIKLSNKMLTNAIPEIQEQFYKGFKEMHSEKLFERLYSAINKNIFLHDRHPNTLFQVIKIPKHKVYVKFNFEEQILKFFKSLCENHFEKLQGFIARPTFQSTAQYHLLELVIQYLAVLVAELKDLGKSSEYKKAIAARVIPQEQIAENIQYRTTSIYKQCIASLRSVSEAVQGPHKENQKIIAETNFFLTAMQILQIPFKFTEAGSSKGCTLKDFELARLKNECAILLLSIMEQRSCRDDRVGRREDEIVTKMRQNIKEEVIAQNIVDVFYAFEQECQLDFSEEILFEHLEKKREDIKHSFVLDLGFNLIFILRKWYDGCIADGESSVQTMLLNTRDTEGRTGLQQDDIVSSIYNFIKDFYGGFVDIGKRAAKIIKKNEYTTTINNASYKERAFKLFQHHSTSLEIVRSKTIETVYFPVLPYFEALSEEQKQQLFESMPIGQQKAKLLYVIENASNFIQDMNNEYMFAKFFKNFPVLGAVSRALPLWKELAFYLSIMLNLIILFSFHTTGEGYDDLYNDPNIYAWHTRSAITALGSLQTAFSLILVVAFLFKYSLQVIKKIQMEQEDESKKSKLEDDASNLLQMQKKAEYFIRLLFNVILNLLFIYHVSYLIFAFLGLFLHPFFFAFHIITVIMWFPKLTSLLKAIWGTAVPIMLTLVLFFIFEYAFALVAYQFYHDDFNATPGKNFSCNTLMNCFWTVFDQTFKNNGGVGAFLAPTYEINGQWVTFRFGRFIFDFLFNFTVVMLATQLLQGLIINKFGDLRDRQNELEEDLEKECIICGESKETINRKKNQTFKAHIKGSHAIWNYYMFIGYLKRKPPLEHAGIESYAFVNYNKRNVDWLPFALYIIFKNTNYFMVIHKYQSEEEETNLEEINKELEDIIEEVKS